jgi:hypothetical protein
MIGSGFFKVVQQEHNDGHDEEEQGEKGEQAPSLVSHGGDNAPRPREI